MASAARIGDTVSVHECGVTPTAATGSPNVFINGIAAHRVGDTNTAHPYAPVTCPTHETALTSGSPNVFVNGQPLGRVGDPYSCGITVTSGSPDVLINESYTPTKTSEPLMRSYTTSKLNVLEMIAALTIFNQIKEHSQLTKIQRDDVLVGGIFKTVEDYNDQIEDVLSGQPQYAKDVQSFRGAQGSYVKGKWIPYEEFITKYKDQLDSFGKLNDQRKRLREQMYEFDETTKSLKLKSNITLLQAQYRTISDIMMETQKVMIDNMHHQNIADILWKHSSIVLDKPIIIERIHKLYDTSYEDNASKPVKNASTYSATVVNAKDIDIESLRKKEKMFFIIPAGSKVIHTGGLADFAEILVSGDTLNAAKIKMNGTVYAALNTLQDGKLLDSETIKEIREIYVSRNNSEPPKWWADLMDDVENTSKPKSWRLNLLLVVLTGTTSWFSDTEEYWDIWKSSDMKQLNAALTKYYGESTWDMAQFGNANIPFHDRMDNLALAMFVQTVDVLSTLPFAAFGVAEKHILEDNIVEGWIYLMEGLGDLEEAIEDLLTPPEGW